MNIIPKNSAPSSLGELRNLSCTPLFSKVLETFVLNRLKSEIKLDNKQYGGVKGSSTDHFLLDTWDAILRALETPGAAVNLVSIDFEKAFNRMDHVKCLEAITDLGATELTVDWIAAFLFGRTMSVKVHGTLSEPRPVNGGSPQGSILGNILFCATTNRFANIAPPTAPVTSSLRTETSESSASSHEPSNQSAASTVLAPVPGVAQSTPSARGQFARFAPPRCLGTLDGSYISDQDESFDFFRIRRRNFLDSSTEEDEPRNNSSIQRIAGVDSWNNKFITSCVYIDDYNAIEKINTRNAVSHISTSRRKLQVHAAKSEYVYKEAAELATEIKMRVNQKKTQMLCMHPFTSEDITSFISTIEGKIVSTDSLKILGFYFNKDPNANFHVTKLVDSFYAKLWSLRFLKRSGMGISDLIKVFDTVIRPSVEYSSVIYNPMISKKLADKLELVQKQAIRIIYGYHCDYDRMVGDGRIETLKKRRDDKTLIFAKRALANNKFGPKWFKPNLANRENRSTTHRPYLTTFTRNERMCNNPLALRTHDTSTKCTPDTRHIDKMTQLPYL